ncbi:hypothetical protein ABH917_003482 [Thermobifida halotolerans]
MQPSPGGRRHLPAFDDVGLVEKGVEVVAQAALERVQGDEVLRFHLVLRVRALRDQFREVRWAAFQGDQLDPDVGPCGLLGVLFHGTGDRGDGLRAVDDAHPGQLEVSAAPHLHGAAHPLDDPFAQDGDAVVEVEEVARVGEQGVGDLLVDRGDAE